MVPLRTISFLKHSSKSTYSFTFASSFPHQRFIRFPLKLNSNFFHSRTTSLLNLAEENQTSLEANEKEQRIANLLKKGLKTDHVKVIDVSGGCGAMYNIEVLSSEFNGVSLMEQHRMVNSILSAEIQNMHGLILKTKPLK